MRRWRFEKHAIITSLKFMAMAGGAGQEISMSAAQKSTCTHVQSNQQAVGIRPIRYHCSYPRTPGHYQSLSSGPLATRGLVGFVLLCRTPWAKKLPCGPRLENLF